MIHSTELYIAAYVVFMAAVSALEPPPPDAPYWVRWAYRFVNTLAVNIHLPNQWAGRGPAEGQKKP